MRPGTPAAGLVRLLYHHSSAEVTCVTSRSLAGTPLSEVHPTSGDFPSSGSTRRPMPLMRMSHSLRFRTGCHDDRGKLLSRGIKVVNLSPTTGYQRRSSRKYMVFLTRIISLPPTAFPGCTVRTASARSLWQTPDASLPGATLAAAPLARRAHTVIFDSKTGVSGRQEGQTPRRQPIIPMSATTSTRTSGPATATLLK